jgi:L-lactate utilization protein LutB
MNDQFRDAGQAKPAEEGDLVLADARTALTADARDVLLAERETQADLRDAAADRRDRATNAREKAADERDRVTDTRNHAATQRQAADQELRAELERSSRAVARADRRGGRARPRG